MSPSSSDSDSSSSDSDSDSEPFAEPRPPVRRDADALAKLPLRDAYDLVVIDVSFISLELILPNAWARAKTDLVCLVKPQFEVGRDQVGRGGVVRDDALRAQAVEDVTGIAVSLGFSVAGTADSRVAGAKKGNREIFALFIG